MKVALEAIRSVAPQRGAGYEAACLAAGQVLLGADGREMLELSAAAYEDLRARFSPPSLVQQTAGLAGAMRAGAKAWLTGREPVSAEEKTRRLTICEECEFWIAAQRRCAQCGCYMDVKTGWRAAKCPVGKW